MSKGQPHQTFLCLSLIPSNAEAKVILFQILWHDRGHTDTSSSAKHNEQVGKQIMLPEGAGSIHGSFVSLTLLGALPRKLSEG